MDRLRAGDVQLALSGLVGGVAALAVLLALGRRRALLLPVGAGALVSVLVVRFRDQDVLLEGFTAQRVAMSATAAVLAVVTMALLHGDAIALRGTALAVGASAGAVWVAVPETSAVLVVAAGVGTVAAGLVLLRDPGWALLAALAALLAASVATGFTPGGVRTAGAAASLGLLVWWPIGQGLRAFLVERPGRPLGPWLLVAHVALALLAARWVGAAGEPGWWRLLVVGLLGTLVSAVADPTVARRGPSP